ncbi:hypothetical protein CFR73_09720 [Novacetimonas maltaceti]|uniref:DUF4412 domain-containing protein n=2 Tax=Novacetimonas maltaceti TaxID=1203393 RepID=A0A2S3W3Y6_9PROT|nr:hypothetical protein KMAL_07640 [Novacetimonas maltaceti]PYD59855.1 hypothetical protein CFR73_09720 [Novacetimonas maltaceti]
MFRHVAHMRHGRGLMLAAACAAMGLHAPAHPAHAQGAYTTRETFLYQNDTIALQTDAQGNDYVTVMEKGMSSALKMHDAHIVQVFDLPDETVAVMRGRSDACATGYATVSLWDGHNMRIDSLPAPCAEYGVGNMDRNMIAFRGMGQDDTLYLYMQHRFMESSARDMPATGQDGMQYTHVTRADDSAVENPDDPFSPLSQQWVDNPAAYRPAHAVPDATQAAPAHDTPPVRHVTHHRRSMAVPHMEKIPTSIPRADETDTSQPVKLDLTQ